MVATPIGNLNDFSQRARDCLAEVDLVACEDTRHSRKLLSAMSLRKDLVAIHEHNEFQQASELISRVRADGLALAYISDAGTPGISDPGMFLCAVAHEQGVPVYAVPGPSALTAAVSAAGFPHRRLIFGGFFPRKGPDREREIAEMRHVAPCSVVYFESPQRIEASLQELERLCGGDIEVSLGREVSKVFESHRRCLLRDAVEVLRQEPVKGEFTLCLSLPATFRESGGLSGMDSPDPIASPSLRDLALKTLELRTQGVTLKAAARKIAPGSPGFRAREIYQEALNLDGGETLEE